MVYTLDEDFSGTTPRRTMNYIDWIQTLFDTAVATWRQGEEEYGQLLWMPWENLAEPLGLVNDPNSWFNSDQRYALVEALRDVAGIGLIELDHDRYRLTDRGEMMEHSQISASWQGLTSILLTDRQEKLLKQLTDLAQEEHEKYARLVHVNVSAAWEQSPGAHANPVLAATLGRQLADKGLAELMPTVDPTGRPTYAGLVRATQGRVTEDQRLVAQLLDDWETVESDVKEILKLDSPTERAEFARDIMGLVNTKARAGRYMLLGFNDETRSFTTTPDTKITQDRMEDVLGSHCEPLPPVKYRLVPWETGSAGLIEVIRQPHKLPYRATRSTRKLTKDAVYVRHGTHVTEADAAELNDLKAEGDRARELQPASDEM